MSNSEERTANLEHPDQREGILFVVSAPSGAGKTSLCRELIDSLSGLRQSVSFTTRRKRSGEVDGADYHFVAPDHFSQMIAQRQLAEWAEVHDHLYGTALETLNQAAAEGIDLLLDIDCQGAAQLKQNYRQGVYIFILPPGYDELERRLNQRGTDDEVIIQRRLQNARDEIRQAGWYDYLVVNDDFSSAREQLRAIVVAERCRVERNQLLQNRFS